MIKGEYVIVKKLKHNKDAETKAGSWESFNPGQENETGLPVEYWAGGKLLFDIEEGKLLLMIRDVRNGEKVGGVFNTSQIQKIDVQSESHWIIHTRNSVYSVEAQQEA